MYKHSHFKLMAIVFLLLLTVPSLLWATIKNEGNDTVFIKITRTNKRIKEIKIYPDQSVTLPQDATEIVAIASRKYGDEVMSLKISKRDGTTSYIKKTDVPLILNSDQKSTKEPTQPKVENDSNIEIRITVLRENGKTKSYRIGPAHSVKLPFDTVMVHLKSNAMLRGDEDIEVKITRINGETKTLGALGAKIQMK